MSKIKFRIIASDIDGTVVGGEGRVKLDGDTIWTIFTITDVLNAETDDLADGLYNLEARVQDNDGAWSEWYSVANQTVVNQIATANAGTDLAVTLPTSTINLAGVGGNTSYPGGIISTVWSTVSGLSISDENSLITTISGFTVGSHVFTLTVTYGDGTIVTDTMTLIVNPVLVVYGNIAKNFSTSKNDCPIGSVPVGVVTYSVAAGTYTSTISQDEADALADADITANAQTYINANGSCNSVPIVDSIDFISGNCCSD